MNTFRGYNKYRLVQFVLYYLWAKWYKRYNNFVALGNRKGIAKKIEWLIIFLISVDIVLKKISSL